MKITAINTLDIPHNLVVTRQALATEYGVCVRTIETRIKEIAAEKERYGDYAVIKDGGICVVNYLAFTDYMANRSRLKEKNLRKHVEPYDPAKVAKALGLYGKEMTRECHC